MTLRRGRTQTVRIPSYGEGVWPNRHITLIVAENVKFTVPLALFTVYGGGGLKLLKEPSYDISYANAVNICINCVV